MLTAEQAIERKKYLGSSEIAAVMGLDPFRSAGDIWLEKRGMLDRWEGNENTERGTLLEPVILDWAEGKLKKEFHRNVMKVHPSGVLCTNFDALVEDDSMGLAWSYIESVEAKSTVSDEEWGNEGTDEVPPRVILQCHMGFACLPTLRAAWVPVLMPGYRKFDFRLYRVERDEAIVEAVVSAGTNFMQQVREGVQPDKFSASIEVLKRVRREPGKIVEVDNALVGQWAASRQARLGAEKVEAAAEAALIAAIGDGDCAKHLGGLVTYTETKVKGHTKVVEPYSYRTLRMKKGKP